jgi:hypothetical protein
VARRAFVGEGGIRLKPKLLSWRLERSGCEVTCGRWFDAEEVEAGAEDLGGGLAEEEAGVAHGAFAAEDGAGFVEAVVGVGELVEVGGEGVGAVVDLGRRERPRRTGRA